MENLEPLAKDEGPGFSLEVRGPARAEKASRSLARR